MTVTRGTTNGNARGSSYSRRARRAWLIANYASDVPGYARCYRCGVLLYNPDARPDLHFTESHWILKTYRALTVDRIIPGCKGGRYTRDNIRPACGPCNSETGGGLRATSKND